MKLTQDHNTRHTLALALIITKSGTSRRNRRWTEGTNRQVRSDSKRGQEGIALTALSSITRFLKNPFTSSSSSFFLSPYITASSIYHPYTVQLSHLNLSL